MKRKIAILLSAMMVTSAMPFSVNAAQLKSDGIQNQGYAKANEPIDPAVKNAYEYDSINDLKARRSVLKINLNDDGTDLVQAKTSFYVDLENGKFVEELPSNTNADNTSYGYVNITGEGSKKIIGLASDYTSNKPEDADKTYVDLSSKATLKEVWEALSANVGENTEAASQIGQAIDLRSSSDPLVQAINSIFESESRTNITSKEKLEELLTNNEVSNLLTSVANPNGGIEYPELSHIPYHVEYVSPTRLKVTTIPKLEDTDKNIKLSNQNYTANDLEIQYFEDAQCNTPFDYENGTKKAESVLGIKIVVKENVKEKEMKNAYIALPLGGVIADGNGPVKAIVTADYNDKVVGGEYTITKGLENSSTTLVYDTRNIKRFDDKTTLEQVTIRENVRNSIGQNNNKTTSTFTIRLNSGFKFRVNPTSVNFDGEGREAGSAEFNTIDILNDSTVRVTVTGLEGNRRDPIGIAIKGLEIEPSDEKNYGDVELTVSGDGINTQTVKVAERSQLGFKLETLKDPTEIISGRHYQDNDKNNMVEADNATVEIKFSESIPNTLVNSRNLDFNLPEGVKFVRAEIDSNSIKNFGGKENQVSSGQNVALEEADFDIINNGRTLRLNRNTYGIKDNVNNVASFVMKLNLSIDPAFTGDIKLSVVGGGQSEGTTPEVVIAKAKAPFEIKTQSTKVDLGYQDYNTADIVITETKPGMFLEGETAILALTAPYGTGEVGFSEAKFEVTGGELNVKEKDFGISKRNDIFGNTNNGNGNGGVISFKIDKASYKNPSTITIKNVKIGSTRSVPFGSYSLAIGGKAVINNYQVQPRNPEDKGTVIYDQKVNLVDANAAATVNHLNGKSDVNALRYQDDNAFYEVKDYVNVVTATGTFNETVKVSVGEKTILLGDKAIDMDVAPYIQASSNSTMVPLRFVSVALGVDSENAVNPDASNKIAWDANTKTTTIYYGAGTGQKIIQFQAGSNIMTVDGTRIPMEYGVKAEIKDGRMFVPFRALGQALGVTVTWDADTRTAIYNENNARNVNNTTTASTTESTTETTTASTSSTESTTSTTDSTTETTTAANN